MSGSSRTNSAISRYRPGVTETTACPNWSVTSNTSSPNCARSRSPISAGESETRPAASTSGRRGGRGVGGPLDRSGRDGQAAGPLLLDVLLPDLLLQLDDPVQQSFGARGASRNV